MIGKIVDVEFCTKTATILESMFWRRFFDDCQACPAHALCSVDKRSAWSIGLQVNRTPVQFSKELLEIFSFFIPRVNEACTNMHPKN